MYSGNEGILINLNVVFDKKERRFRKIIPINLVKKPSESIRITK